MRTRKRLGKVDIKIGCVRVGHTLLLLVILIQLVVNKPIQ